MSIELRIADLRKSMKDAEMKKVQLETKLEIGRAHV